MTDASGQRSLGFLSTGREERGDRHRQAGKIRAAPVTHLDAKKRGSAVLDGREGRGHKDGFGEPFKKKTTPLQALTHNIITPTLCERTKVKPPLTKKASPVAFAHYTLKWPLYILCKVLYAKCYH